MKSFSRISGHPVVGFATLQLENNLLVLNVLQKRGSAFLFPVLNSVGFFCLMKDKTVEFQESKNDENAKEAGHVYLDLAQLCLTYF